MTTTVTASPPAAGTVAANPNPQLVTAPGAFAGVTVSGTASAGPTAATAHTMLKALMLELGFVVVATMLAGVSDSWATGMVALMLALLVLRGLFEVDIFAAFASGLALAPKPFTGGGGGDFGGHGASGSW